jgi:hypothetical protein
MHIWGFSSLWIGRMDGGRGMFNSSYCWGLEGMREMGLTRGGGEGG